MDSVKIIKAVPADLRAITIVENASFTADRFSRRQLAYLLTRAHGVTFVAKSDGQIVGYISILQRAGFTNLRIYSIAVLPDMRGKNIGQKLLNRSKKYAIGNSFRQITLEVRTSNKAAIELYTRNGFEPVSVIKEYYSDGADALKMRYFLKEEDLSCV